MKHGFLFLLIPVVLSGLLAAGCEFSTANVKSLTLAEGMTEDGEAINPTSEFPSSGDKVHALVAVANAPEGTVVRAVWHAVEVPNEQPVAIDSMDMETGSATVDMSFGPLSQLPAGRYRVDIYLNPKDDAANEVVASEEFTVVADGPRIDAAIITTDPEAATPVTQVQSDVETIYALVSMADVEPGTAVEVRWIQMVNGVATEIDRAAVTLEQDQYQATFTFSPTTAMPAGEYSADVHVNGAAEPARRLMFEVPG